MDIDQYFKVLQQETSQLVDNRIRLLVERNDEFTDLLNMSTSGGKRLRPTLVILIYRAIKGDSFPITRAVIDFAAIIELIHSASLIIDDMIDFDLWRRGAPSLWAWLRDKIGKGGKAILASVVMVSLVNTLLLKSKHRMSSLNLVNNTLLAMAKGAMLDTSGFKVPVLQNYFKRISLKTATLFAMGCQMGGLSAGLSLKEANHFYEYGHNLGIAYQIADDLIDVIMSMQKGKPIGDLSPENRVVGYPLVHLYHHDPTSRELLHKFVKRKRYSLPALWKALEKINAIKATKDLIKATLTKAVQSIPKRYLKEPTYQKRLEKAPAYIVNLMLQEAGIPPISTSSKKFHPRK